MDVKRSYRQKGFKIRSCGNSWPGDPLFANVGKLAVVAIIGIASVFDERTDSVNRFDHLLTLCRYIVLTMIALAAVGQAIVFPGARQKPKANAEQAVAPYR